MTERSKTYFEEACAIGEILAARNCESWAYFVGGGVRDRALYRDPKDYDIVTNVLPEVVQEMFPKTHPVGAKFGIIMVETESGNLIEVATARMDGTYTDGRRPDEVVYTNKLEEDLARRDFTMNAMAWAPWLFPPGRIYDPFNGQGDISKRVIRTVGDPDDRFKEDALRMMRAVRFACQLGFDIESDTEAAIRKNRQLIKKISVERIREELFKILTSQAPHQGIGLLFHTGLMDQIDPSLSWIPWKTDRLLSYEPGSPTLGLALLLYWMPSHDKQIDILDLLKLSTDQKQQCLANLLSSDLRFLIGQDRATRIRIARDKFFPEAFLTCKVVLHEAGRTKDVDQLDEVVSGLPTDLFPAPLLTGDDLIAMGYTPGPKFKEVLYLLETEQLNRKITTRDEAEKLVKGFMQ